jgi:hypothetical protein
MQRRGGTPSADAERQGPDITAQGPVVNQPIIKTPTENAPSGSQELPRQISITPFQVNAQQTRKYSPNSNRH